MATKQIHGQATAHNNNCPEAAFRRLGLIEVEIAGLARQGFVRSEERDGGVRVFKLRFRAEGRQRVKFLGRDAGQAAAIERALAELQATRRNELKLRRLNREAAKVLRESKRVLVPLVTQAGFRFHGLEIRKPRRSAAALEESKVPHLFKEEDR
jgi:hypothetical protein